jgi:Tol biopolymer transport system component
VRAQGLICTATLAAAPVGVGACDGTEGWSASTAKPAIPAPRLTRPELVAFRAVVGNPPRYGLVAARGNGERVRLLARGSKRRRIRPALFEPATWSPDGRRRAFTAELGLRDLAGSTNARDIYVMRADGSRLRRLTSDRRSFHPVWSPDGRRIFFARRTKRRGGPLIRYATSIWSMRAGGTDRRQLTTPTVARYDVPGSFSPDGATLAFTRRTLEEELGPGGRARNTAELWVMRPDGSEARRLARRSADPAFSPDGRQIAFASDRDENGDLSYGDRVFFANELYVMGADGSDPRRLTRTPARNELHPSWLPSGARIAYQRGRVIDNAEGTVVMQANADGSCPRPVLANPRLDVWYAAPVWRPGDAREGDDSLRC